eukprot:jgi/Picre1/32638/NNA_007984.t1
MTVPEKEHQEGGGVAVMDVNEAPTAVAAGGGGEDRDFTKMSVVDTMIDAYYGFKTSSCRRSFANGEDLKSAIKARCPAKIDIGPVYNVDPQKRAAYAAGNTFAPVERELVFDIDITDYDDVRTCGKDAHICTTCWPLMATAIDVLDDALRNDFGFQHVFFVFSGRRGVHAWVCDEKARKLPDEARAAIAQYLSVYKGLEKGLPKLTTGIESHPFISRTYDVLAKVFESKVLPGQKFWKIRANT